MGNALSDEIKSRLTMRQVASFYGYEPNRSGFLRCPFHSGDREASLKLYPDDRGWHCFGCGRGGSVIDFVMDLYDLDFKQAVVRLNDDFGLGLSFRSERPSYMERRRAEEAARKRREEKRRQEEAEEQELALIQEHQYWWEIKMSYCPDSPDNIHPLYEQAVKILPYLEYQIEEMADRRWNKWAKKTTEETSSPSQMRDGPTQRKIS